MDQTQVALQVEKFLEENFIFDPDTRLQHSQSLLQAGIIDSTGILELVSFLEKTYSITIEDEELIPDNLDSIDAIAAFVAGKV